jgi:hypothetical protein
METEVKEDLGVVLSCGKIAWDALQGHGDKERLSLLEKIVRDLGAVPAYAYFNFDDTADEKIAGDMMLSAMIYIEHLQTKGKTAEELLEVSRAKLRVQLKKQSIWINIILWLFLLQQSLAVFVQIYEFKYTVFSILGLAASLVCSGVCVWLLYKSRKK